MKIFALSILVAAVAYLLIGAAFTLLGLYTWTLTLTGAVANGIGLACGLVVYVNLKRKQAND